MTLAAQMSSNILILIAPCLIRNVGDYWCSVLHSPLCNLIEDTATMVDLQETLFSPIHEETVPLALPCTLLLALGPLASWRPGQKAKEVIEQTNASKRSDAVHTHSAHNSTPHNPIKHTIWTITKDIPIHEETVQLALPCTSLQALGPLSEHMGTSSTAVPTSHNRHAS